MTVDQAIAFTNNIRSRRSFDPAKLAKIVAERKARTERLQKHRDAMAALDDSFAVMETQVTGITSLLTGTSGPLAKIGAVRADMRLIEEGLGIRKRLEHVETALGIAQRTGP
jgi:hypothetical protein